jgi:hypothetical protein
MRCKFVIRWWMFCKHNNKLKNHNGPCTQKYCGHPLLIIKNNHCNNWKGLLTMCYSGLKTISKKNQSEDENNHNLIWQGEWNCFLMYVPCMIMFFLAQQLSLHFQLWTMHIIPYWGGSNQLWQQPLRFKSHF